MPLNDVRWVKNWIM